MKHLQSGPHKTLGVPDATLRVPDGRSRLGTDLHPRPLKAVPSPCAPATQRVRAPWASLLTLTTWHRAGAGIDSPGPPRGPPAGPRRRPGHGSSHVVTMMAAF